MRFHDVTSLVNESAPDYAKPALPRREYSRRRTGTLRALKEFLSTTSKPLSVVRSLMAALPPFRMTSRLEESSGSGECIGSTAVGPPVHFTAAESWHFCLIEANSFFTAHTLFMSASVQTEWTCERNVVGIRKTLHDAREVPNEDIDSCCPVLLDLWKAGLVGKLQSR
jgi:hypothetical protein